MKKIILNITVVLLLLMTSCESDDISGFEYLDTETLAKGIYVEKYSKSDGVYGGWIQKYFLTDSVSSKIYLAQSEDKEFINFTLESNKIKAEKYSRRNLKEGESSLQSIKYYTLP